MRVVLGLDRLQPGEGLRIVSICDPRITLVGYEVHEHLARAVRLHCLEEVLRPCQLDRIFFGALPARLDHQGILAVAEATGGVALAHAGHRAAHGCQLGVRERRRNLRHMLEQRFGRRVGQVRQVMADPAVTEAGTPGSVQRACHSGYALTFTRSMSGFPNWRTGPTTSPAAPSEPA